MNKEDKELLLNYLSMALPYGVKIYNHLGQISTFYGIKDNFIFVPRCGRYGISYDDVDVEKIKPYLRPMLSMTEAEKEEMHNLLSPEGTAIYENNGIALPINHYGEYVAYEFMNRIIQYLLKNHFDFMGLIPKCIAIEVTENNNPYKN